jgi:hypothetical protein
MAEDRTYHRPGRSRPQSLAAVIGGYIDPTRTEYRGVVMRSRLEADFARHLDAKRVEWTYEPAVFRCPGERGYLPDFRLIHNGEETYVEVKPTIAQAVAAMDRVICIWDSRPDALLVVVSAEGSRWYAAALGQEWRMWTERWAHQ